MTDTQVGCVHGVDRPHQRRPDDTKQGTTRGASTGLEVRRTGVSHGPYQPFVNTFTFHGTIPGYGSSKRRRDHSHPHRSRMENDVRTRLKLLTVGLVLATAAMAGCSSTTGSSGAVQNAATAPASSSASAAASSAASTAPAPSPDPVTPTAEPTEAQASPVASPTDSVALPWMEGKSSNPCNTGLTYACGQTGPGGGVVFYVASIAFACGANMASTCNYLEVAPNLWNPDSKISCKAATGTSCGGSVQETSDFSSTGLGFPWCTGSGEKERVNGAIGTAMGEGFANTTAMLSVCNPSDAGNVARSYTGGGLTDWSLGSFLEMIELYSYDNRAAIGGFNSGSYWSSSQDNRKLSNAQNFSSTGGREARSKSNTYGLRPVRAF